MSEIVNQLASQTGISSELIQKGLGAFFSFLKKELGEETYTEVESSVPGAANALKTFETAPEATASIGRPAGDGHATWPASSSAERPEQVPSCWRTFPNWGSSRSRSRAFLPKALELIKTYLSPELIQKILAALPALAAMLSAGAKKEA